MDIKPQTKDDWTEKNEHSTFLEINTFEALNNVKRSSNNI